MLPLKDRVLAWAASWLGWAVIQFVAKTSRIHFHYPPGVKEFIRSDKPFIYAFWHRYQLLNAYVHRGEPVYVLVSQSKDGELIARALNRFGMNTVRGSSSRRAAGALLELIRRGKEGKRIVFTPDGPRGPLGSVHQGVIAAARETGHPVLTLAWAGTRVKELSSWDRFLVPLPFARYHVAYGPMFHVEPGDSDEAAEEKIRGAMNEVASKAELLCRGHSG